MGKQSPYMALSTTIDSAAPLLLCTFDCERGRSGMYVVCAPCCRRSQRHKLRCVHFCASIRLAASSLARHTFGPCAALAHHCENGSSVSRRPRISRQVYEKCATCGKGGRMLRDSACHRCCAELPYSCYRNAGIHSDGATTLVWRHPISWLCGATKSDECDDALPAW